MTRPKTHPEKVGPFTVRPRVRDGRLTGGWQIDVPAHVSPTGRRQRLTHRTKSDAVAKAKSLLRELHLDGAIRGIGPRLVGITFTEVSERWLEAQADRVATQKKREISLTTHAIRLKALLAHLGSHDINAIAAQDIVDYQKARIAKRKSPATVNSETRLFRQIMAWALDHDLIVRVPKIEPIPEPRKRVVVPTTEEVLAIIAALPPKLALLVRFLAETGCRKGEAFALEWSDIDQANGLVMIRRKDGWTPKTAHSDRDIPLAPSLLQALMDARRAAQKTALKAGKPINPLVFPGRGGVRMTDFDKALASAVKRAGVARDGKLLHLTPHMLRKAHATWLKMRGVDDSLLQPRLGHAPGSRVTAHNYVHLPSDAQKAIVIDLGEAKQKKN